LKREGAWRQGQLGGVHIGAVYVAEDGVINTLRDGNVSLMVMWALSYMSAIHVRFDVVWRCK